ncbi:aminotransferase class III-fold pyridoxal phosphate-dependent enzyme [Gordonia alkanivorans]|uniref:aminotransferase class III-fold pyridoxal phosphate-dependent enzyme n=1 Tax=Gordonia alkanivorans TaxID=84096 RepID=UPI00244709BA|nr:aminotransferase class III-fold pyridoxal phosphate-dependent enzyme [Gordonia alkanivorans]MDH3046649.1 aminotransferase class III-fold pyridoxal phosphate-dependent enzyme [Gordonia alkanivorans]
MTSNGTLTPSTEKGTDWIARAHRDHVLSSWSKQSGPDPITVVDAAGCWFVDSNGNRYLDFLSQLVNLNLGHQHPRLVEAITEQARKSCFIGPTFANEARSRLALELDALTPGNLTSSFFTTGGAAANEAAIAIARAVTGRHKVVARYRSYHGASAGAMTLTGDSRRWGLEPLTTPGVVRMLDPYVPGGGNVDDPRYSAAHLEEVLQYENPGSVAAVIMETVTGTNGPIVPPPGYLKSIREVCDRHGILLICDEVMVGFGRLGTWFGIEQFDVVPDILTTAKGINSGYVPLGATIVGAHIRDVLRDIALPAGLTYAGHPLACGSAVASIEIMKSEGVVENAATQGARLQRGLEELTQRHPSVGGIRGLGLMWGIDLVGADGSPLIPFKGTPEQSAPGLAVVKAAKERGLWIGRQDSVIRLAPPLIITADEIDLALSILDEALVHADEAVGVVR